MAPIRSTGIWQFAAAILFFILAACTPQKPSAPLRQNNAKTTPLSTRAVTPTLSVVPSATPLPSPSVSPTPVPPSPTATATVPACLARGGKIEIKSLHSALLPKPLAYRVYTPPCYDQNKTQRYPVIYLIHGQTYNDDQWDRLGIDETADELIASGELSPFLVVMPRDRVWKQPPENNFGKALISELIPEIDRSYRTIAKRNARAIGGLSWGANWAVHLGLTSWELFGAIGAHSLPVFSTDGPRLSTWLDAIPSDKLPRIYMDAGEHDRWLHYTLWFESLLTQKGIPHEWHLFSGYHDEAYWSAHTRNYLLWYARRW